MAIRRDILGDDHPETAQSLHNFGVLMQDTGDYHTYCVILQELVPHLNSLVKRPFDKTPNPYLKMLRFPNKFGINPLYLFLILINSKNTFIFETPPRSAGGTMRRLIGYARVSTPDQSLDLQFDDLKAAGCKMIFADKISGTRAEGPGLDKCLNTLRAGDTLVVCGVLIAWDDPCRILYLL